MSIGEQVELDCLLLENGFTAKEIDADRPECFRKLVQRLKEERGEAVRRMLEETAKLGEMDRRRKEWAKDNEP